MTTPMPTAVPLSTGVDTVARRNRLEPVTVLRVLAAATVTRTPQRRR